MAENINTQNIRLAEALVNKGYLSQEQAQFALKDSKRSDTPHLAQYLIRNKWVDTQIVVGEVQNLNSKNPSTQRNYNTTRSAGNVKSAAPNLPNVAPGQTFGNYVIIREIARGGMGIVYLAQDASKRNVALKVMLSAKASDQDQRRFVREGKAISELNHPNIVKIYAMGEENGCRFFTMDYVDGGTFSDIINNKTMRESVAVLAKIARALAAAHSKRIIHRDIKPDNILMDKNGEPYITDFGLAKIIGDKTMTRSGSTLGTPQYMAPEQAMGETRKIDHRTDLYALGVMLYKCLTKQLPFHSDTLMTLYKKIALDMPVLPRKINEKVPRYLERVCLRAMDKNPKHRYQSGVEFAKDLEKFLQNRHGKSRVKKNYTQGMARWLRRNYLPLLGVISAVIMLLVAKTVFFPNKMQKPQQSASYQKANGVYKEAHRSLESGDWKKAISLYKKTLGIEASFTKAYIGYAKALIEMKKLDAAHKILDKALANTAEEYRDIRMQKARLLIVRREFISALKLMNKVVANNKQYAPSYRLRASIHKKLDRYAKANDDEKRAEKIESSNEIDMQEVEGFLASHRYAEAFAALENLQSQYGESAQIFYMRSRILYTQKNWTEALSDISQAIAKTPSVKYYLHKAKISFAANYYDDTQQILDAMLLVGDIPKKYEGEYHAIKAKLALARKDYAQAYQYYRLVLQKTPSAENYLYFAQAAYYLQKYAKALFYLDEALAKKTVFRTITAQCHLYKGIVYREIGKHRDALAQFTQALKMNQSFHLATVYLGAVNIDLENYERGFVHLQKVQNEVRNNPLLYEYLAKYYLHKEDVKNALENLKICLKIIPWESRYYYLYGLALIKDKNFVEAEDYLIRSLELQPGNLQAFTPLLINLMDQSNLEKTILVPGYYNSYTAHFWSNGEPKDLFRDQYNSLILQYRKRQERKKGNSESFIKILDNPQQNKLHDIAINALSYHYDDETLLQKVKKRMKTSKSWAKLWDKLQLQKQKAYQDYMKRLIVRLLVARDPLTFKLLDKEGERGELCIKEILLSSRENMLMRFLACRTLLALGTPTGYTIVQDYLQQDENGDVGILATVALKEKNFRVNERVLIQGLKNTNPLLRSLCTQHVRNYHALLPLLADEDERVKVYAANQLIKVSANNRERCYDILAEATKSENPFVRIYGCMSLWPKKIHREYAATPSAEFIQKYQSTLIRCVQDTHPTVKRVAATRIGAYFLRDLAPYLLKLAKEDDSSARYQALISLGWMRRGEDVIKKISANPSESLLMRSTIIPVLHSEKSMNLPFKLDDLIAEEGQEAARFVMSFIGIVAGQFGPFLLMPYVKHKNPDIQASAICGMIFHGQSSVIPILQKKIKQTKSKKVRVLSYATMLGIMSREQRNKVKSFHRSLKKKPSHIRESAAFGYYFLIYFETLENTVTQIINPREIQQYDIFAYGNIFKFLYERLYLAQFRNSIRDNKKRKEYMWRLTQAIDLFPNTRYHYERALIYAYEQKWQKAIDDMMTVVRLDPKQPRFYPLLLDLCYKAQDYQKILKISDKLTKLNPRVVEGWKYQADVLMKMNRHSEALNAYTRSFVLEPTNWMHYINMGRCRFQLQDYAEALHIFLYVSNYIYPTSKDQVLNVLLSYARMQKYKEAVQFLKNKYNRVPIAARELRRYKDLDPLFEDSWVRSLK
ncbi:serine/threonine-protein kinase [Candidatus Uabimicrobium amorphum]|uniref:non-specific serine/threonine protein kinase n=1 Tax=Uabimicrobium amorphum TaxID=2596890 RepID=A0A5S9F1V6_UABAM|nr:serine/threonine-protein kinase [Candidatus Uabimicrobium amorphum]BBM81724.1 protein kinase [Candidatus Uabimicrobium amorphum]